MLGQKHGESFEAGHQIRIGHCIARFVLYLDVNQAEIRFLFTFVKFVAVLQKAEPPRFVAHHRAKRRLGGLKGQAAHALQAEENNRELPLVLLTQGFFPGDLQTAKQALVGADLKEALQHAHIQGLAKAPGPGKEVHLSPVVQKLRDKSGLINIIEVIGAYLFKAVNADGKFFLHLVHAPFPPAGSCISFQIHFTMKRTGRQALKQKLYTLLPWQVRPLRDTFHF